MQPQGFVHAPQDIVVSPVGALSTPRGSVYSPTGTTIGGRTAVDLTPPKPNSGSGKRLLAASGEEEEEKEAPTAASSAAAAASDASSAAADGDAKKLIVSDDPLDLSKDFPNDYRNWAAVLSQVLLTKEGNSAEQAKASLQRLMLAAHGHLAKVAAGEELLPRFHLQDPVLSAASSASPFSSLPFLGGGKANKTLPPTSATAFSSSSTFFNYAPCILSESATGLSASVTGLNISPSLFSFSGSMFEADTALINLQPQVRARRALD